MNPPSESLRQVERRDTDPGHGQDSILEGDGNVDRSATEQKEKGEYHELGLAIDPADPSKATPVATLDESLPDESWDLDRLARYASTGLTEADRLEHESIQIGRRSTVQIYRSGRALS